MPAKYPFDGFPKATVKFYRDLSKHNDRIWFNENKPVYQEKVLAPAQDFVLAMGARLKKLSPNVMADTRTTGAGSIFRIYRDTRFSKDKSPYKAYLGILWWEGGRKKMESPSFYFHLEPNALMVGIGFYMFPKERMATYRDAAVHAKHGPALARAVKRVESKGYKIGGKHYKRTPRGYDPEHKNAELLLYNGLWAGEEAKIPKELYSSDLLDYCYARFKDMLPIYRWLVEAVK